MKTALCFRYAQTLLQVGQADLLRAVFVTALHDNSKQKQLCIRFAHTSLKAKALILRS